MIISANLAFRAKPYLERKNSSHTSTKSILQLYSCHIHNKTLILTYFIIKYMKLTLFARNC